MITTIIVVDSFIEDGLYNILNFLKNSTCCIIKLDLYSITKDNIHVKIREYMAEEMETQTMNVTKILFVNFDVLSNNTESELFLGEVSKLYNLKLHDNHYKSWKHINETIVTLSKSFEIDNVDFIDINHLVYYESYVNILKHIEKNAIENESFNVSVNYFNNFLSFEQSETIKSSSNWLDTLFGTLYSQNVELKQFLDLYFQVNNTNLNFLKTQNLDSLDIFSKEFIEFQKNEVSIENNETRIMMIPLHYYENKLNELIEIFDGTIKDKCYITFIHERDEITNVNEMIGNVIDDAYTKNNSQQINVNILLHVPKNTTSQELAMNKEHMSLLLKEGSESVNIFKNIFNSLLTNSKVKTAVFGMSNIPEENKDDASNFFKEVVESTESSELEIVLDTPTQNNDNFYKPFTSQHISHRTSLKKQQVKKDINESYILDFVSESSFDTFTSRTKVSQLILYDASLSQYLPEVYASLTEDTEIIIYHSNENFELLKEKIRQMNNKDGVDLNNVALFKKNIPSMHFSLFNEEKSLKYDILEDSCQWINTTDPSHEYYVPTMEPDVSMEDLTYESEPIYPEGHLEQEKEIYYSHYNGPDPSLNTWEKFSDFLLFLQDEIEVSNFDILTCKLIGPDWKHILETLQKKTPNMTIHSSIDTTGHVMFEGDWILETPKNVNLVGLYFNDNIYDVKVELDSYIFTSMYTLHLEIRNYLKVSTHQTCFDTYGDISTWKIGTNLKTFKDANRGLFYYSIWASGDYRTEKDWSKLNGISNWDVSHMTSFESAFSGNSNYLSKFNIDISSWNVSNVTSMQSAFSGAIIFNQDLSNWDTRNVNNMSHTFYHSWSFNQNIDNWNVSNVTNLTNTFAYAYRFNKQLNNWNVHKVTNFNSTFNYATSFDQDLSNWNVSNGTYFGSMFRIARSFTQVLGGHWKNIPPQRSDNTTVNGINTNNMFAFSADDYKNIPIGHIEVDYDPAVGFTSLEQLKKAFYIDAINSIYAESLFGKMRDWDVSKITSLDELCMIQNRDYHTIEMENWNVSNVTSMEKTFSEERYFDCDLSKWDVSKVTNMNQMFYNCVRFNNDISSWDTSNVTDMTKMFYSCKHLKHDLRGWDTTNADTTNMFQYATYYNTNIINSTFVVDMTVGTTTEIISTLNYASVDSTFIPLPSSVTSIDQINMVQGYIQGTAQQSPAFTGVYKVPNKYEWIIYSDHGDYFKMIKAGAFVVDGVIGINTIAEAFIHTGNPHYSSYSQVDDTTFNDALAIVPAGPTGGQTNSTAYGLKNLQVNIEKTTGTIFNNKSELQTALTAWKNDRSTAQTTYGHISTWDVGLVTDFSSLFSTSFGTTGPFSEDLSNWNTSNVTNMNQMCYYCRGISPKIDNWDVSKVTSINSIFYGCYYFNGSLENWNVGNVTDMNSAFRNCLSFNGNIKNWDVSKVTRMAYMFHTANYFNRDLTIWNIDNVTNFSGMFTSAEGIKQVFKGKWMDIPDRMDVPVNSFGNPIYSNERLGIGFKNNGANMNNIYLLRQSLKLYIQHKNAALINYPEISQWNISNHTTFDSLFQGNYVANLNIGGWNVSNVTSMKQMFHSSSQVNIDFSNWNVSNVKEMGSTFSGCLYSEIKGIKNWDVSKVTNMSGMFANCYLFNGDVRDWQVQNVTSINSIFSGSYFFNRDLSNWNLESINKWGWVNGAEGGKGIFRAFYNASSFNVVLGKTWTVLDDQINSYYPENQHKTFNQYLQHLFPYYYSGIFSSPGTVSTIPYNAPKITFTSTDVSNNSTYETDEINMQIILTQDISGTDSITSLISATNGTIKQFYLSGTLTYSFKFESNAFGQTSEFNITSDVNNPLSEYVVETFAWTWSPPVTVMTFNSPDISNNQTQTSSSIDVKINLSREFITNEQLIQKEDVSITNGVVTGFQRVNNTQYTFTFIATSPNVDSVIQMDSSFDASNTILPSSFTWTWTANIEQPSLVFTSRNVANNGTIKKNEIDMLLTYTTNSKLAFSSLSENDISFTNGFIVSNTFSKISPTKYSFKFRSLSRDTNSTIFIPQNQFQYNFVDGATNLTENYEGSDLFTWKYNGLDIELINNKTVAVITSDKKESKSLELILNNGVVYDPQLNEYEFSGNYMSVSGEIFNGSGEASITFWYKTNAVTSTQQTILALRNSNSDNFIIQRNLDSDYMLVKSTGSSALNSTVVTEVPFYNTNYVFMAIVFGANEMKIYKNSVLERTEAITTVINSGTMTHQIIGASVVGTSTITKYFNGCIKNLRFYNYAIPISEVNALQSMYNIGMNDTAPQISNVSLSPSTSLTSNSTTGIDEHTKAFINMEMNVTYDNISSISSIDSQSFIIDKSNFDTSFGYVFDFVQLSETRISFKFGASTTTENSTVLLKADTITRNINSTLNVVSNPVSNSFTWKYKSEPLTITSIKSNLGVSGSSTNKNVKWIQTIFSEEVFNFKKSYISGTNCKVIKVTGSGTTYAIKVQTFRPTSASIVIDIPTTDQITTGKGLNKALANANNSTYNWNYDNIIPTFEIQPTQKSGLTNNADYVDITIVTSRTTTNFDASSINLVGSAEIVNFTGSGQNYSYRIQPFATSSISVEIPSAAFSDEYGNSNTTSNTFTWNYQNIVPEVYISSQDINSGDSADLGSIETYFVFSKPVVGFTLADVDATNGNLSDLTVSSTYPEHVTTFTVTVSAKSSIDNPYYGKGSSNAFFLNGEEAKVVSFVPGNTYTFNNSVNVTHPLKFYTNAERTSGSEYTTGVTVNSTSTVIVVDSNTPTTLYYQCEQHEYMGNIITYSESYKATLIPATSSVSISLQIATNKVKDSIDIFNDVASNTFIWNYTGTEYMVSIESSDLKSGASHLYKSINVEVSLTYATFDTVDASTFTVVNGSISNIVNNTDGTYDISLESVTPNTETSIIFLENSVTRSGGTEKNKESNKFVWTYNPPVPQLTITSNDVEENAFTNNSSIDLQLEFTENVTLDMNMINISNAAGTLTGSNNLYVLNVIPNTIADSSADILVEFPEGSNGFYNYFDNENLYADISYSYAWKYDSVIPTGTISSSVSSIVQDICTNIQDVPFDIEFNKEITALETNNFTVSANGALSGLSGSGSIYSFVISSLDNTIDNVITFKLGDGAITDRAGNSFSSTNEFSFTIAAKVSKVLDTSVIADLFEDDTDIASEDKLSADEINMVLAVEIPDFSVPDFDEVEGGEVAADVSYSVTVDTKTSSNSYYNQGSSSAYFIDGSEAPSLALDQDNVYRFNQEDGTNSGHPLLFFEDVDKTVQYTTDVSVNGTPGTASAYTQISITSETPTTLYYQCGNHNYMGGTITIGEVDNIPVITLPPAVTITNSKVFTRLIDQILEKAEDVTAIKMSLDDVAISEAATEKIPDVEQVVMAKSNQIEPPVVIENTDTDSVLFVPLANVGDLVRVEINGSFYLTEVNSDNTFSLTIDGVATGSPFSKDDVYEIDDTNSIIFGSQIISSSPPPPDPPTLQITSSTVQAGATTSTGDIDIDLSFSTTVEFDLNNILTLTSDTQITSSSIQSVDSSNSIVSVSVSPILPDVSASLGILINDVTFYSTYNNTDYYNDVSYSFAWNYDATEYNNANVVVVVEEAEPAFINPNTGEIPCFLENTNILTTKGYKKVQELIPGKDKLVDHKNNVMECLEIAKYVKLNDGKEYPHKIPRGSRLSKDFICHDDLYLTYNHCVYLPTKNMFAPVSMMKNIKKCISDKSYFVYYHVFTNNYFSDTLIANGVPCESHSKYTFKYLDTIDKSGRLLKKIMNKVNMLTNCQRNRISRKDYKKIIKKTKNKYKNSKK